MEPDSSYLQRLRSFRAFEFAFCERARWMAYVSEAAARHQP
jgi:hypothetical protein